MKRARERLDRLTGQSLKVINQMPLLHRAVAGAMVQNLLVIIEELLEQVEELTAAARGRIRGEDVPEQPRRE
jgi:hypothetical protein